MDEEAVSARAPWEFLTLLLVGLAMYLAFAGILALVSRSRRRRELAKVLVAVLTGTACGALGILLINTVVNAARPGAMMDPAVPGVGVVTGLTTAVLLSRLGRLREVVGRSWMTTGFHSLALPVAVLISFSVGGTQAGDLRTVALSVGGLLLGVFLVFVGDRVLRPRRRSRPRARFDLSRPHA